MSCAFSEFYCILEVCSFKDISGGVFKAVVFSGILISFIHKMELMKCPFPFFCIVKVWP